MAKYATRCSEIIAPRPHRKQVSSMYIIFFICPRFFFVLTHFVIYFSLSLFCNFREWQDLFYAVHSVCLWDEKGPQKIRECLEQDIVSFIKQAQSRVLIAGEEQALLKAYIIEWRKFFTQSSFLPLPFWQLEAALQV